MTVIKIICGLGNPGIRYQNTRHNLGFDVVDRLVEKLKPVRTGQMSCFEYFECNGENASVNLIKPTTFVNRSGEAGREALEFFEADSKQFFVICDDFNLPLGSLRIRTKGSSGGHNGLDSIISELGVSDFPRLRIGIGPLPESIQTDRSRIYDFVLERFYPEEVKIVENMKSLAVEALLSILNNGLDLAISKYNRSSPTPEN